MAAAEWKNLTDGSFKGFTFHVAVPQKDHGHGITSKQIVHERKLQVVDRPLVDGSGTNDYGRKGRVITASIIFHGINYNADFQSFLTFCNEGSPGVLVLPDEPSAIHASYHRMTEKSEVGSSNSKSVEVTWIESDEVAAVFVGPIFGPANQTIVEQGAKSKSFIDSALAIVNANSMLSVIRSAETGLSTVRSAVNAVTSLTEGVRNRIAAVDAEIRGTLSQIKDAIDEITNLLGKSNTSGSTFSASVDPTTGQRTANFADPDEVTPAPDPLANTQNAPTTIVDTGIITSADAAIVAVDALIGAIESTRDELVANTSGHTDDVYKSMTGVIATLKDFKLSIKTDVTIFVVVPIELSLMEICFANGLTVDDVDDVYSKNRHVTDPLVVAQGTVISL